ncbi:MFS transporter [Roseibium sp.]|uniref:MFS transporter n=1 Tax=Roseibium sp. TaxID=1936156 RepID=UPI003B502985
MFQNHRNSLQPSWLNAAAIGLLLTATLKIMANATISPALPDLEASFSGVPNAGYLTRFLVAAPSLTVILVAPLAGLLADRIGKGGLLIGGVVLFALAGSAGAYLPDLQSILISRFILGAAVALTMTAQVALVGDLFEGSLRSAFLGWQTVAINFSGLVFITFAGVLAGASPRLPFLVYLLPVLLLPLLVKIRRQEREGVSPESANAQAQMTRVKGPWLGAVAAICGLTMCTVMLFFLMPSQIPFYLVKIGVDPASGTAVTLGVLMLSGGMTAMLFKRLSDIFGLPAVFAAGFATMAAGFGVIVSHPDWSLVLAGAALIGAGYSLVQPGFFVLALKVAPGDRRGSVSGLVTTAMFAGQVVSPLLLTAFLQSSGFQPVFWGAGGVFAAFAIGAIAAAFLGVPGKAKA